MDETAKMENHLSSAAAFMEGGILDASDDACSICLEGFSDSDPSTVTCCKHEFHLQCVLEWYHVAAYSVITVSLGSLCQRSSQCPMCWQPISFKDPTSQELLEAVEREKTIILDNSRITTIFHNPAFGDFDLQHLPVVGSDDELEERIIQHLAAAAARGRARYIARRGRLRSRSHGRSQYLVPATNSDVPSDGSVAYSSITRGESEPSTGTISVNSSSPVTNPRGESAETTNDNASRANQIASVASEINSNPSRLNISSPRRHAGQSSPVSQDRPGPSDFQSLSESLKSRLNAVSMRYKESISKSTRGWRERLFSRNNSVADIGSNVRREVNTGFATVARMMERLDIRDGRTATGAPSSSPDLSSVAQPSSNGVIPDHANLYSTDNTTSPLSTSTPD